MYLATLRTGHVFLPLNTAYQKGELTYFIQDARPAVIVCAPESLEYVQTLSGQAGVCHLFTLAEDGSGSLMDEAARFGGSHSPAVMEAHELAAILYTSGTTGRSKGAMLTHGNLLSNASVLRDYWDWQEYDVLIHALPIFHAHGLFVAVHGALLNGSKMVWLNRFDKAVTIENFRRATIFMGVPTMYVRMLADPALNGDIASGMRLFVSGSAPLLSDTFNGWRECTGHEILERYGMSETVMLTSNPCRAEDGARVPGTVGRPLPGVQLRIRDNHDRAAALGEVGVIQVKSASVFKGYWDMPEKTAEALTSDGWFKTGDLGKQDAEGYVTIVGRGVDLVISGGYNVYPAEVESYLNELPSVLESAVVGVPHPEFGEVCVAVVTAPAGESPDSEVILAGLKGTLANFKIPKRCFVVDELPRNAMGKVQKNVIRERYRGLFGTGSLLGARA